MGEFSLAQAYLKMERETKKLPPLASHNVEQNCLCSFIFLKNIILYLKTHRPNFLFQDKHNQAESSFCKAMFQKDFLSLQSSSNLCLHIIQKCAMAIFISPGSCDFSPLLTRGPRENSGDLSRRTITCKASQGREHDINPDGLGSKVLAFQPQKSKLTSVHLNYPALPPLLLK